jgi:hypothetical protein
VVDKTSKIAHLALKDLIWSFGGSAHHHVHAVNSSSDETDELGNGCASVEFLPDVSDYCMKGSVQELEEVSVSNVHSGRSRRYSFH